MLEARQITCRRGDAELFRDLNFRVDPGYALLMRGANGSGKTSLLRILSGLSSPHAGEIWWRGERVAHGSGSFRACVLYLGHAAPLKDDLSVRENLDYALRLDGCSVDAERQAETLATVGLGARRHLMAKQLSQGQRRRLGIARMMLAERALWLLDEPATALDTQGLTLLIGALQGQLARGGLAILTTHQSLDLGAPSVEMTLQ